MNNADVKVWFFSVMLVLVSCKSNRITETVSPRRPNIIFFIADDMYPWMFNNTIEGKDKNGNPANLTPNMDRLTREGVWLENIKVVSPVCTPSRYNCITGMYASRAINESFLGFTKINDGQTVIQWNAFVVPGQKTMGTYFQEMGYKTGFFGKNHVIESKTQVGESGVEFDLSADLNDASTIQQLTDRYTHLQKDIRACGFDVADRLYHNNPNWLGNKGLAYQNMDWITEGGVQFIHENKNNPFLLYFATTIPHNPTDPEHSWKADRRITAKGLLEKNPVGHPQPLVESIEQRIKAAGLEGKNKENLLWLDDALGVLIQQLEKDNILNNTIIIFFNDHGQNMKGSLYEGGLNSEAFIWQKGGFKVGQTLNDLVSNIDFLPTMIDLAGGDSKKYKFDGVSFEDALKGSSRAARTSMYHELGYARAVTMNGLKYYAIRHPQWALDFTPEERRDTLAKYSAFRESFGETAISTDPTAPYGQLEMVPGGGGAEHAAYISHPHYTESDQLYDVINDPKEHNNLINDVRYVHQLSLLKSELQKYLLTLPGKFEIERKKKQANNCP